MNELILTNELKGLPESKAAQIKAVYEPMIKMLEDLENEYNEVMAEEQTPENCKRAKELRGKMARVRIDSDKARKGFKREHLLAGRAVDGVCNTVKFIIGDKEDKLKERENYYERQEEERAAKVQAEREAELVKYNVRLEAPCMLGKMTEDIWVNYRNGVKLNCEAVKKAERKAEQEKQEAERRQAEERERISKENERLKVERDKLEKERRQREAELEKERKQREQLEAEKQQQEEARKAQERQHKEAERKRALAPDKEKLLYFADALQKRKGTVDSHEARAAMIKAAGVLRDAAGKLG